MFGPTACGREECRPAVQFVCSRRNRLKLISAAVAAGLLALAPIGSEADEIENFYKGKQVTFITGSAVGSDYDQWARTIARHLDKHIPGNPVIVVQNMPGGGQIIAANHLYNISNKDGSVIGVISRNLPYLALTGHKNVRFDPTRFNWIGSPETVERVCAVRSDSEVKTADDLYQKEALIGGTGAGGGITNTPILLSRLLGFKFKVVEGYTGSPAIMLAVQRKEIDGICIPYTVLRNSRTGNAEWTFLFNLERNPIKGASFPTIYKYTKTEQQRQVISLYNSSVELGRPILMPPDVPTARVSAIRKAFEATLNDPDLKADAEKQKFEVNLISGETLKARVDELMATPKEIVELAKTLTK